MIPLAYSISKKNIQTHNTNLCHLPYDKYRKIRDDGSEEIPPDVYAESYQGRRDFAREVLECHMRNIIRKKIMDRLGLNLDNINNIIDYEAHVRNMPFMTEEQKKSKVKNIDLFGKITDNSNVNSSIQN